MEFAGFKTAVVVPAKSPLGRAADSNRLSGLLTENNLVNGWGLNSTGFSGTTERYVEFAIDHLPSEIECAWVMGLLQEINNEEKTDSTDLRGRAD